MMLQDHTGSQQIKIQSPWGLRQEKVQRLQRRGGPQSDISALHSDRESLERIICGTFYVVHKAGTERPEQERYDLSS